MRQCLPEPPRIIVFCREKQRVQIGKAIQDTYLIIGHPTPRIIDEHDEVATPPVVSEKRREPAAREQIRV